MVEVLQSNERMQGLDEVLTRIFKESTDVGYYSVDCHHPPYPNTLKGAKTGGLSLVIGSEPVRPQK